VRLEVLPDVAAVAARAASLVAGSARDAVARRGRFTLAVSGGTTPGLMLERLAAEDVPWERVHLFQVDERVAPAGHPDRNLTQLEARLLASAPLPAANLHPMPVEVPDPGEAAASYQAELERVAGSPPVLDLVHLGLGDDGHTASLFPGEATLEIAGADVAPAGSHGGRARLTLTLRALDGALAIVWVVTGAGKAPALARLLAGDRVIPAGRVRADRAVVIADRAAAP